MKRYPTPFMSRDEELSLLSSLILKLIRSGTVEQVITDCHNVLEKVKKELARG